MYERISALNRCSESGNAVEMSTASRSALASRSTAVWALSASLQTWAAKNPTSRAKTTEIGGSMPGEIALNARNIRSSFARDITAQ